MKHANEKYDPIQDHTGLIPEDEPVFLLRATDPCTPAAMVAWLIRATDLGVPIRRREQVAVHATTIDRYQAEHKHLLHLPGTAHTKP